MSGAAAPRHLWPLIAVMILGWSANFTIAKFAVREMPPLLVAGLRMMLASLFILPLYFWRGRRASAGRWRRSDILPLLGIGILGIAGNQVLFLLGIQRTSVAHAVLLFVLTPVLVLLAASALKHEQLTGRKIAGMAIALAGVLSLQVSAGADRHATVGGDLLILAATVAFASFTVFGRPASVRLGSITVNTVAFVGCSLVLLAPTLWSARGFDFSRISLTAWASILYMAAFPSVVCYLIYYYALTYLTASRVAAFTYLEPPLAAVLAIPLLGENITYAVAMSGALVLAGVYLTERTG